MTESAFGRLRLSGSAGLPGGVRSAAWRRSSLGQMLALGCRGWHKKGQSGFPWKGKHDSGDGLLVGTDKSLILNQIRHRLSDVNSLQNAA
jgi:hypothetical protein